MIKKPIDRIHDLKVIYITSSFSIDNFIDREAFQSCLAIIRRKGKKGLVRMMTHTSPRGNEFVCFQLKDEATTYYTLSAKSIRVNPASSRCCFLNQKARASFLTCFHGAQPAATSFVHRSSQQILPVVKDKPRGISEALLLR